jgi:hypothetical protein
MDTTALVFKVLKGLLDLGVECNDGQPSVPVGHNEAVEVDIDAYGQMWVAHRVWDRTGGLSYEEEIGNGSFSTVASAVSAVRARVKEINEQQDKIEKAMSNGEES